MSSRDGGVHSPKTLRNSSTGDLLISRAATERSRLGWDLIWGTPEEKQIAKRRLEELKGQ